MDIDLSKLKRGQYYAIRREDLEAVTGKIRIIHGVPIVFDDTLDLGQIEKRNVIHEWWRRDLDSLTQWHYWVKPSETDCICNHKRSQHSSGKGKCRVEARIHKNKKPCLTFRGK